MTFKEEWPTLPLPTILNLPSGTSTTNKKDGHHVRSMGAYNASPTPLLRKSELERKELKELVLKFLNKGEFTAQSLKLEPTAVLPPKLSPTLRNLMARLSLLPT